MNRKPSFWMGRLVLAGLVAIGVAPNSVAQVTSTSTPAAGVAVRRSHVRSTGTVATPATGAKVSAGRSARVKAAARQAQATTTLYSAQRSTSRKATLARARAAATTREMQNAVLPRYKVDQSSGDLVPDVRAAAAIVYDPETGQVLWEENSQDQRSIASITKVMTAIAFLENDPDVTTQVAIERSDVLRASTTRLRANDRVTVDDLLHLLLIASDNVAARVLARISPFGYDGLITRMNQKALELGLEATHYTDPSGLLPDNVSSAYDMARLIAHASGNERISAIMRTSEYTIRTPRRNITFHSTNHLLGREDLDVRAAKTGFISKAGYCLATLLRLPQSGQDVAVVVLGARSNAGRFVEVQNLFTWMSGRAASVFATTAPVPQQ